MGKDYSEFVKRLETAEHEQELFELLGVAGDQYGKVVGEETIVPVTNIPIYVLAVSTAISRLELKKYHEWLNNEAGE